VFERFHLRLGMFAGRTLEQDGVAGVRIKGRIEIKPALPAPKGLRTQSRAWPDGAKTAGYKDEPVVVLHAVDSALINPVGWVVVDLLKRASFNVEDRISGGRQPRSVARAKSRAWWVEFGEADLQHHPSFHT
jgi:hypothetical protein